MSKTVELYCDGRRPGDHPRWILPPLVWTETAGWTSGILEGGRSAVSVDDLGGPAPFKLHIRCRGGCSLDLQARYGFPPHGALSESLDRVVEAADSLGVPAALSLRDLLDIVGPVGQ